MRVVVTAPSLDESKNVSGISTVVSQMLKAENIDYVHFVAGKGDDERRNLGWLCRQLVLPIRFYRAIKKADIVHVNTALNPLSIFRDLVLAKIAKCFRKPVIIHVHGGRYLVEEFRSGFLKTLAHRMLATADLVLVLSDTERKFLSNRWDDLKVEVLRNAISSDEFTVGCKLDNLIVFMGRMHESKGLEELKAAFESLKNENFLFHVYGNGPMRELFIREMRSILGEKFYYGGIVSGSEKIKILSEADIVVLPSRYGEGLPMVLLEAMASGCIVIASRIASIVELIEDGVNGFLIEPRDVSNLIEKLNFALEADESEKLRIRQNARRTIESGYYLGGYLQRLEELYRRVLK